MRALMARYRLGNLFVCKHELLLSKCPLTANWLLIRSVWNEISNEALNYNPIPEHIISHTYCMPLSVSQCFIYFCQLFYVTPFSSTSSLALLPLSKSRLLFLDLLVCFPSQGATAAGDLTSVCSTWSSTGALAVGDAVWTAETTPTGPIVSAAKKAITENSLRSPADPATVISMVRCNLQTLNWLENG